MSCIFCRIIAGELASAKVLENDDVLAIRDRAPQAPVHVLVMPKRHVSTLAELDDERIAAALLKGVRDVAVQEGLREFRTIANTGASSGQTVFHLHLHVLGGRALGALG
ncbi:MAG: Hit-like protein involved in cell-cycle [Planctomycetota bacterium]|nr:MAG: Hit-like protein involved in cell-cycle [Planctomycetota bacterium]